MTPTPPDADPGPAPGARPGSRVVRAMLFGDVKGFSKLNDEQLPIFARSVLGAMAAVVQRYGDRVGHRNTWGDALYVVLTDVASAAACALEVQDAMSAINLEDDGLPAHLALRLSGHVGPVFPIRDPVIDELAFMGSRVSRTARIEPVTLPGSVYVSEPFAAALELEGTQEFAETTSDTCQPRKTSAGCGCTGSGAPELRRSGARLCPQGHGRCLNRRRSAGGMFGNKKKLTESIGQEGGVVAWATILHVSGGWATGSEQGYNEPNRKDHVKIRLRVEPDAGQPFEAEFRQAFSGHAPLAGFRCKVIYDPKDHSRIAVQENTIAPPGVDRARAERAVELRAELRAGLGAAQAGGTAADYIEQLQARAAGGAFSGTVIRKGRSSRRGSSAPLGSSAGPVPRTPNRTSSTSSQARRPARPGGPDRRGVRGAEGQDPRPGLSRAFLARLRLRIVGLTLAGPDDGDLASVKRSCAACVGRGGCWAWRVLGVGARQGSSRSACTTPKSGAPCMIVGESGSTTGLGLRR